jgi:hypothetical protein
MAVARNQYLGLCLTAITREPFKLGMLNEVDNKIPTNSIWKILKIANMVVVRIFEILCIKSNVVSDRLAVQLIVYEGVSKSFRTESITKETKITKKTLVEKQHKVLWWQNSRVWLTK